MRAQLKIMLPVIGVLFLMMLLSSEPWSNNDDNAAGFVIKQQSAQQQQQFQVSSATSDDITTRSATGGGSSRATERKHIPPGTGRKNHASPVETKPAEGASPSNQEAEQKRSVASPAVVAVPTKAPTAEPSTPAPPETPVPTLSSVKKAILLEEEDQQEQQQHIIDADTMNLKGVIAETDQIVRTIEAVLKANERLLHAPGSLVDAPATAPPSKKNFTHEKVTHEHYESQTKNHESIRVLKEQCPFALLEPEVQDPMETGDRNRILLSMPRISPPLKVNNDTTASHKKQPEYSFRIPKIIMMTNKQDAVPRYLYKNMMRTRAMHPDWEFHHYSDQSAREFIESHMSSRVLEAFDMLIPGAFKADLFRYCFLYVKGGVYCDADQLSIRPIAEVLKPEDEFVSAEDNGNSYVYNAFIAVIPRHPIIVRAVDVVVDKVLRQDYGRDVLDITGPEMFGKVFATLTGSAPKPGHFGPHIRLLRHTRKEFALCSIGDILDEDGARIMWSRFPEYKSDVRWLQRQANYWDLWRQNAVYNNPHRDQNNGCWGGVTTESNKLTRHMHKGEKILKDVFHYHPARTLPPVNERRRWRIPRSIVQMHNYNEVPSRMSIAIDRIIKMNPDFEHHYFSHKAARQFIAANCESPAGEPNKEHTFSGVLEAFDRVDVAAFKADIFRYCYLYVKGGVWIDADMWAVSNISSAIRDVDIVFPVRTVREPHPIIGPLRENPGFKKMLADDVMDSLTGNHAVTCLLGSVPHHKLLKIVLEKAIQNVNSRYYGPSPYHITGPALFSEIYNDLRLNATIDFADIGGLDQTLKQLDEQGMFPTPAPTPVPTPVPPRPTPMPTTRFQKPTMRSTRYGSTAPSPSATTFATHSPHSTAPDSTEGVFAKAKTRASTQRKLAAVEGEVSEEMVATKPVDTASNAQPAVGQETSEKAVSEAKPAESAELESKNTTTNAVANVGSSSEVDKEAVPSTNAPPAPEPATPEPPTPEPATPEPATPEPPTPEPVTPEPATPEPPTPEPATSEPSTPEPATSEPSTPEPSTVEPASNESTASPGSADVDSVDANKVEDIPQEGTPQPSSDQFEVVKSTRRVGRTAQPVRITDIDLGNDDDDVHPLLKKRNEKYGAMAAKMGQDINKLKHVINKAKVNDKKVAGLLEEKKVELPTLEEGDFVGHAVGGGIRELAVGGLPGQDCYVFDITFSQEDKKVRLFWSQYSDYPSDVSWFSGEPPVSIILRWKDKAIYPD